MTPLLTAICVTYGRASNVEQAIAMFLAQDYPNKRMVILNTFPRQTLLGSRGDVLIVNCKERPSSMGACRNLAIEVAEEGVLCVWDDDDQYSSRHLSTIAKHFTEGVEWVWLDKMFFCERNRITKITTGSPNCFAFTKQIWKQVGGYPDVNTGEDRQAMAKFNAFRGVRVALNPEEITFAYGWATGDYHVSGYGFDEPGAPTGYAKVGELIEQKAAAGLIPVGEIVLKPELRIDPDAMIAEWLSNNHHVSNKESNDVCIVQLGRHGDICNILPVALRIFNTFAKPYWMISREFAPLLDGVSYVTSFVTDIPQDRVIEAIAIAKRRFKHVVVTQVWGQNYAADRRCYSYNRESWRLAGFEKQFDNYDWKPLFDRRDAVRESALLKRVNPTGKPMLLVNVTRGVSSPYPRGTELLSQLVFKFAGQFQIVDLATIRLERIYDVLALMERAEALVSIDTAHAHLCAAVDCPTIAICNDKPWLGTVLRHNNVLRFTYADSVENIMRAIEEALCQHKY